MNPWIQPELATVIPQGRLITAILCVVGLVFYIVWDIIIKVEPTKNDTISAIIRDAGRNFLLLPFALGVCIGHWFWGGGTLNVSLLAGSAIAVLILSIVLIAKKIKSPVWAKMLTVASGMCVGHFFWSM